MSIQSERVTLRIPTPGKIFLWISSTTTLVHYIQILTITVNHSFDPDNESDTEVPYADIMITVRGVSTPELTQVGYLTPGDQKEVRDETAMSTYVSLSSSKSKSQIPKPAISSHLNA